jgi:opacity protein-like surface antigen
MASSAFAADPAWLESSVQHPGNSVQCYAGLVAEGVVSHPRVYIPWFGDFDMYGARGGGIVGCDYRPGSGWFGGLQGIGTLGRARGQLGTQIKGEMASEIALRLRLGVMMSPSVAAYVASGPVAGRWSVSNNLGHRDTATIYGAQFAVGVEYHLTPNWRLSAEYALNGFNEHRSQFAAGTATTVRSDPPEHIVRGILSYALSADAPVPPEPARPGGGQFSCYVGVLAEGVLGRPRAYTLAAVDNVTASASFDLSGARGGGIGGCDHKFASGWFVGGQASAAFGRVSGNVAGAFAGELTTEVAARVRIGTMLSDELGVYAAGGPLAGYWSMTEATGQANSKMILGGQAALGIEYAFMPNWRIGAEYGYSYYDHESSSFALGRIIDIKLDPGGHHGRVLLSYGF